MSKPILGDAIVSDERAVERLKHSRLRGDRILVEVEEPPTVSPGGITLLPPEEEARQSIGRVIAVGPGDRHKKTGRLIPMSVKVGDRVAFSRYGHTKIGNLRIFREPSTHYVCDP